MVGKKIFILVVTHIEFAHIRPLKVVLTLIGGFRVVFTAWWNSTTIENRNPIFKVVLNHF